MSRGERTNPSLGSDACFAGVAAYALLSLLLTLSLFCTPEAHAAVNQTLSMPPNTLGLVGHWTFDGPDMINNVADSSGQGNTGYLSGFTSTTTVPGVMGQALQFNSSDSINAGNFDIIEGGSAFTESVWLKLPDLSGIGGTGMIFKYPGITLNFDKYSGLQMVINSGCSVGYSLFSLDAAGFGRDRWTHVVGTYDGTTMQLYANGALLASGTCSTTIPVNTVPLTLGSLENGSVMDDVRIYNRALSAAEVQQLYSEGTASHQNVTTSPGSLSSGLVGHWTFDGPDMINNVADSSGQGNNGHLSPPFGSGVVSTSTTPGAIGQGFKPTASNAGVVVPQNSSLNNLGPMTITMWAKFTPSEPLLNKTDGGNDGWSFGVGWYDFFGFQYYGGSSVNFGAPPLDNKWHFVALTIDATRHVTGYLDNTTINSSTLGGGEVGSDSSIDLHIGCTNLAYWEGSGGSVCGGDGIPLSGPIDDVRIYNRPLSAAEVQELYSEGTASHQNVTLTPPNLAAGLVGHWTFDGPDMIKNVADSSGSGNTGDLIGFTSTTTAETPGVIGQALSFNGSSDYVRLPSSSSLEVTSAVTVSAWYSPPTTTASGILAGSFGSCCGYNYNTFVGYNPTSHVLSFSGSLGNAAPTCSITYSALPKKWYLLSFTYDGANIIDYVDGQPVKSCAATGTIGYRSPTFGIGASGVGAYPLAGSIDDPRIYNRALSAAEVQELYNLGR